MFTKLNPTLTWLFALAFGMLLIEGCKKSNPDPNAPTPAVDLAAKITGTYTMIYLTQINPVGGPQFVSRTGSVVVTRQGTTLDQVNFKVSITRNTIENGAQVSLTSAEDKLITLKEAGKAVDLYDSLTKRGSWASDTLKVTDYAFSGQSIDSKLIDFGAIK